MGSSVNLNGIKTDGTHDDGVVAAIYQGQGSTLNAVSSQFNAVQLGDGLDLQTGATATIDACTFNGVGTSPNATQASNGLVLSGNAVATIANSQFIGNTNSGLVAQDNSHVNVQTSTFSSNRKGDGALFLGASTADLRANLFSSNGEVVGPTTGLNGVEFMNGFSGTAYISGNSFVSNTGNGLYLGSASGVVQVLGNLFDNNFVGITMDTASGGSLNAIVQGNTIRKSPDASRDFVGILAIGRNLTATIGGDGGLANAIQNYVNGKFIYIDDGDGGSHSAGFPNLTILTNSYTANGQNVSPSDAIHHG
jgi:hypothetical protein